MEDTTTSMPELTLRLPLALPPSADSIYSLDVESPLLRLADFAQRWRRAEMGLRTRSALFRPVTDALRCS